MSDKTIKVRAGAGLRVFFPQRVVAAPGRRTRVLEGAQVIEVPANMRFVRRSIRCEDLVEVQTADLDVVQTEETPEPEIEPEPDFDAAEED